MIDLTGARVHKLTVIRLADDPGKYRKWLCQCECGNTVAVAQADLRRGRTRSCGCFRIGRNIKHGTRTKAARSQGNAEYTCWVAMRSRCSENPPTPEMLAYYHQRGIRVCERWQDDFAAFLADMGPRPSPRHSIDRIDNEKGYSPDNCRWATKAEQSNNRRCTVFAEFDGETLPLAEIARRTGIHRSRVHSWAKYGHKPRGTVLATMTPVVYQRGAYGELIR